MRYPRAFLLVLCLAVFGVATSRADSVTGYFNIDVSNNSVPSVGQVIFTLNGNGTIAASLLFNGPGTIVGFGFNSAAFDLPEYGFTPTTPDNASGWYDPWGLNASGFYCSTCGTRESWIIGNPGDYTSVLQLLTGTTSTVDFYLTNSFTNEWAANAQPYTPAVTPEPGSFLLFGTGAMALVGAIRRKFAV